MCCALFWENGIKNDRTPALRELAFTAHTLSPVIPTTVGMGGWSSI